MPDIEFQYNKKSFSCKNNNLTENNKNLNDIELASNNLNMQTVYENNISKKANSKDTVEIKDNILTDFCQLEDIYNFCNPRNTIIVKLKKGLRGFGISLCGGKIIEENNETSLINQLIRVKKLYPAQPASECGLIDENDFILDVNNHCFVGLTCIEAFNILHSVKDEISLRILKFSYCPLELQNILYPIGLPKQNNSYTQNTSDYFENENTDEKFTKKFIRKIILIKKDGSLGFTLTKVENEGFYVKQITKEPASLEDIYPGDKILSVNQISLDGLDLNSAINFLRSLPDIVELKLEKVNLINQDNYSLNYNEQSENEDENFDFIKKKQLRYEVKIMLDNRNKDELHNRLKRKDLKKLKEAILNKETEKNESNFKENDLINYDKDETIEEKKNYSLQNWIEKENCENIFNSFDENNENFFLRQSSVIDFNEKVNKTSSSDQKNKKQINIIKWRGATLSNDDEEKNECKDAYKKNFVFSSKKKNKEITEFDEQDSGFGESINKTINSSIEKSFVWSRDDSFGINQDTIHLSDIQLKLDVNCLVNENSMYKKIENGLFFYVILDRGWHGRLGFSLLDDQLNDSCFINTIKHGFTCCIVKEIYPNSVAFTNGNIKVGDKLLEVNNQQLINKPVKEVINDLRKMKGKLKLLFLRKVF